MNTKEIWVTGDKVKVGDVLLKVDVESKGTNIQTVPDYNRHVENITASASKENSCGGVFTVSAIGNHHKWLVRRKDEAETVSYKQAIDGVVLSTLKYHCSEAAKNAQRTDSKEKARMSEVESAAWSAMLRIKQKEAREKERTQVLVQLDVEPWE